MLVRPVGRYCGTGTCPQDGCLPDQEDAPAPSKLPEELPAIDECFRHDRLEDIYDALRQRGDAWAAETLQTLSK